MVGFCINTSHGTRYIEFFLGAWTTLYTGGYYLVFLHQDSADWQRLERDVHPIAGQMTPGVPFSAVTRIDGRG
jgi:hypothetical protein